MRLCDFPILTFDTYGTLIDWETGIWDALQPLCSRLAGPPTRETALTAFAEVESACQAANPDLLYHRKRWNRISVSKAWRNWSSSTASNGPESASGMRR